MKKKFFILSLILTLLMTSPLINAKIVFDKPFFQIYNLNDIININLSITKEYAISDYLESYLICNGDETLIFKKLVNVEKRQNFSFKAIASEIGNCKIKVLFNDEEQLSNPFEITDEIIVNFNINNKFFFPLEKIEINGTAVKKNGDSVEGIAIVFIQGIINQTIDVSNGNFLFSFNLPLKIIPQNYTLAVRVIEDKDSLVNKGEAEREIEIKSRPTSIKIDAEESFKPPKNISLRVSLLNQVENLIEDELVLVKIFDPENQIIFQDTLNSGQNKSFYFKRNSTRGSWRINTYYGDIFSSKLIYVEENKEVEVAIVNNSDKSYVEIMNIGNIDYDGIIKIFLENSSYSEEIPININLSVGEETTYPLDFIGSYNVSVDGKNFGVYHLTGAAVFPSFKLSFKSFFLSFLLIVALIVGFFIMKKIKRRKRKERKEREKGVTDKLAYISFFLVENTFDEIKGIARKYNFSLEQLSDNLYFILFSSSEERALKRLFLLIREIRKKVKEEGKKISIVVNAEKFGNKIGSLRELALVTRKLVKFANGGILIRDNIFKKLDIAEKAEIKIFKVNNRIIKTYLLRDI